MKRFIKKIAPYVFYAASALALFSTVDYAQSKVPINSRLVEKGTSTGIVAGEKLAIYTPKGIDTLITQQGGYINGMVTDVKEINSQTPTTIYVQSTTYPNPSGNNTTLNFGIKETQDITCTLYNILGQKIREEKYTNLPAGHHAIQIENIGGFATGVYLTQITGKNFSETRKILHFKSGGGTEPTLSKIIGTGTEENYTKQKLTKTTGTLTTTVIDSAIVLESPQVARTKVMDYLSTMDNPINLGTKEVTVKMLREITAYGVDADSGKVAQPLINADVWTGTRDISKAKYKGKTGLDGKITLNTPKNGTDTLFIQATGYHQRNKLINNNDTSITEYAITDKIDIDFYNLLYLGNSNTSPLSKPDDSYNNELTFYLENPPDMYHYQRAVYAIDTLIAKISGGKYHGKIISDKNTAFGTMNWQQISGSGEVYVDRDPNDWTKIKHLNITIYPLSTNSEISKNATREAIEKEVGEIYGQGDIKSTNVPISWKQSRQYQGVDQVIQANLPQIDLGCGILASKLPRGYIINILHKPEPQ